MKILFENWRKYLSEARPQPQLQRTLHSFDAGPASTDNRQGGSSSVGYKKANDPKFVEEIKDIFINTPDKWVIITLPDVYDPVGEVQQEYFKKWVKEKNYPEDSKILVVGSSAYEGDYDSADWIAHDVIGHTVGRKFMEHLGHGQGSGNWMNERRFRKKLIMDLVSYLGGKSYPISKAEEPFDMLYDVMAAIILKGLPKEEAMNVAATDERKQLVNELFNFCDQWVASIPSDNKQVTVVEPW